MADGLRLIFVLVLYVLLSGITSKNVTIENKCDFTVWPGILTTNGPVSTTTTGFVLKKGEARVINASSWVAYYYVWGRRFCSTNSSGSFSCMIGDCGSGKIECSGGYYTPPVTLAQFRLGYTDGKDRHLVSVAKGYNLPMRVVPLPQGNETCSSNECIVDLNTTCPPELRVTSNTSLRQTVACMSGCQKLDMPEYCCSGPYANDKCMPTLYSQNFKSACPHASTINFEDNSYVACANTTNYVITFCPSTSLNNTNSSVAVADSPSPAQTQTKSGTLEPPSESQQTDEATTGEIKKSSRKLKLVLGISASLAVMIIIMGVLTVRAKNARKSDWNGENFETVVMLKRYSYARVRKMTNSFAHVLGKGGFGTVYKGKLPEGKEDVAVKILKESKENGEEFINEVASISRTSHVNIVSLLGFCYEGNKRAIIYEFMPNGSLDKFISNNMSTKMEWETLSDIAVGVSRGLEYLHNRCASRIVHFDIKPQNILMDKDLCPKISDFGLAKICKNKESIMSVLEARGTAGYIAPEVFLPNYGGVSHKSDVYSYGMVVLEMIGARSREQFEISGSNNTSMYFPDWIYRDFERGEIMRIFGDQITEEEEKIAKKMVLVGLWCIQTNPSHRPSMIKVIEMLEGSLEALQIPPKPLLCLPAAIDPETLEDSYETSNFSNPSEFERSS
ncbi:PR5-like receptor kinase isoform X2 [Raphanus sativus]|uniref:PR5-like receptor kinase isoform X2 n=1 Tax=Raphanus sativus TaxID=3726 RepID=A0A9W3BZQ6_RAPSA|nr:PR5-like receptor kinase isoform X2 [Raphanus sativus]